MIKSRASIVIRFSTLLSLFVVGILSAKLWHKFIDLFFYVCFVSSFFVLILGFLVITLKRCLFKRRLDLEKEILSVSIAVILTYAFLTTVPLNIDRSFSVWMLNSVQQQNKALTVEELEALAHNFFHPSQGEIVRRLNEQSRLGNLYVDSEGKVQITLKGSRTSRFFREVSEFFDLNPKYAQGR